MLKFSCEKSILQSSTSIVSRVVSSKSSIQALEGFLMEGGTNLTISGYNMQTGIRTSIDANIVEEGKLVVSARLFCDIIRRLPDDMVVFTANENFTVHITCGDAVFDVPCMSADEYPALPEVDVAEKFSIQQNLLKSMIGETSFAISTNEARPVHTGSLFDISNSLLTVVSVDGFRLALRKETINNNDHDFKFVVPGSALREVENICSESDSEVIVKQGTRHLMFEIGSTQLICRRLEGEFLDYKNAIPKNNPIHVEIETKTLLESFERISVVISEKLKSPVRCVFDDNKIYLSAKTGNGDANDICACCGDGRCLEIGFNNHYFMDALRNAPTDKLRLELNTSISPCVITSIDQKDDFLYMVLPVRLKA